MRRRDFLQGSAGVAAVTAGDKTVPSVLGPITADQCGMTLPHEHIAASEFNVARKQRDSVLCVWRMLGPQLRSNGIATLVDVTPPDSYRDIELIQEVSRFSGLHILCATGYYLSARRPANFMLGGVEAAQVYMTRELTEGIGKTGVRAALMKIAVGNPGDPSDDILIEAAARTQKATGAPISTHSTAPESRRHLLDVLEKHGADLSRVAIGHADCNATVEEAAQVISRAGFVIFTIWGITNPRLIGSRQPVAADHSARLVRGLLDRGFVDKLMFSIDFAPICLRGDGIDLSNYEIPERTANYVFTFVLPELRKLGVSEDEIRRMMVANPRRHLFGA